MSRSSIVPSHSAGLSPSSLQESINGLRSIIAKTLFAAARPLATSGKWSWAWAVENAAKKIAKNACIKMTARGWVWVISVFSCKHMIVLASFREKRMQCFHSETKRTPKFR